jgi:hypothetical protein
MKRLFLFLLVPGLSACEPRNESAASRGTPVVRAQDGAMASLTIIACPPTEARAMAVGELIETLTRHDELVTARANGIARLTINACPPGMVSQPGRR